MYSLVASQRPIVDLLSGARVYIKRCVRLCNVGTKILILLVGICAQMAVARGAGVNEFKPNRKVLEFSISPRGSYIAELISQQKSDSKVEEIEISRLNGRHQIEKAAYVDKYSGNLKWITEDSIAFVSGKHGRILNSLNRRTGRIRKLWTAPGRILQYEADVSGRRLIASYRLQPRVSSWMSTSVPDRMGILSIALPAWATVSGTQTGAGDRTIGVAIGPLGGKLVTIRTTKLEVWQVGWLGRRLRPVYLRQKNVSSPVWVTSLIDARTGKTIISSGRLALMSRFAVSASGRAAVVSRGSAERDRMQAFRRSHVFILGQDEGRRQISRIPGIAARSVLRIWWEGNNDIWIDLFHTASNGGPTDERLLEVTWPKGNVMRTARWPGGSLEHCKLARDANVAVCLATTPETSSQLVKVNLSTGTSTVLKSLWNRHRRIGVTFRRIVVRNRFGARSSGFLSISEAGRRSFLDGRRVPLAIMLYGFREAYLADGQWIRAYPVKKLVDAGIAVLLLNFPEPQGWEVGDAKEARRQMLEEPLSTVEEAPKAVEKAGINVSSIMIMGWSWGGFIAAHAIESSCQFKAAEVGDPAQWNETSYSLGNDWWRTYLDSIFGGPPDARNIANYLAFDPAASGKPPKGPILFEFVSRNVDAGQYIEDWRAVGADVEAFAYHHSWHPLNVPAEAHISRERNLAWAELNLLGVKKVPAATLSRLGIVVPRMTSYRCR